jgi:hypothetical protein
MSGTALPREAQAAVERAVIRALERRHGGRWQVAVRPEAPAAQQAA